MYIDRGVYGRSFVHPQYMRMSRRGNAATYSRQFAASYRLEMPYKGKENRKQQPPDKGNKFVYSSPPNLASSSAMLPAISVLPLWGLAARPFYLCLRWACRLAGVCCR